MGSNRIVNPVKLFIGFTALERVGIEERLVSEFGNSDHRLSLVPTGGTMHRVFLSFERLIEIGSLAKIQQQAESIEEQISAKLTVGFLDNRRVVVARSSDDSPISQFGENNFGEAILQFKDRGILFFPWTDPDYRTNGCQGFFASMRNAFRGQLRSMCHLRR